jgi:hypothetical protein
LVRSSHLPQPRSSRRSYCAKSVISAVSAPKASDDPDEGELYQDFWDDETQREVMIDCLKAYSVR